MPRPVGGDGRVRAGAPDRRDPAPAGPPRPGGRVRGPGHPPPAPAGAGPGGAAVLRPRGPGRAHRARGAPPVGPGPDPRRLPARERQPAAGRARAARPPQHRHLPPEPGGGHHGPGSRPLPGPADGAGGARDPRGTGGAMTDFTDELTRRVLVCDGAMGTMLHASGISLDRPLPELNLSDPGLVRAIHDSYLAAGADVIQTNTFGASAVRLAVHGLGAQTAAINRAGARIARDAAEAAGRPVFVAGSVSPAVTVGQRGRVGADARAEAVREQVEALVEGGVDLLIFETFGYLGEMVEAVRAAAARCQ